MQLLRTVQGVQAYGVIVRLNFFTFFVSVVCAPLMHRARWSLVYWSVFMYESFC